MALLSVAVKSTFKWPFQVIDSDTGEAQSLNGYSFKFVVKKKLTDNDDAAINIITWSESTAVTETNITNGTDFTTALTGTDKPVGKYFWQLEATPPNSERITPLYSDFEYYDNMTRTG